MSNLERIEIEKVFEIATRFVAEPALFEKFPDGSEFFIGSPLSVFEPGQNEINESLLHVRVRIGYSSIYEDF